MAAEGAVQREAMVAVLPASRASAEFRNRRGDDALGSALQSPFIIQALIAVPVPLPPIAETGDLPQGVYHASLNEILAQFGQATLQRKLVGMRLKRIYELAVATGSLKRFIVFGSFVTGKPDPNDVDVFVVMHDTFDLDRITGEARLIFDHSAADAHFGASVFWLRHHSALPSEDEAILNWQIKRDGTRRGIVEITEVYP